MIYLHFHWSWFLIVAILACAVFIASQFFRHCDDGPAGDLGVAAGCAVLLVALLIISVIGGIFIW